jgi:dephospho-CoA kinase
MIRLGITGGIGSGKSTISEVLKLLCIPVYIADIESKKLTETSSVIREKLIAFLGADLYQNNQLNKKLLASIIFNDKTKLAKVNSIIHPEVDKHYTEWVNNHKDYKIVGLETAILYESNMVRLTDKALVVYTPLEDRIRRTMLRDGSTREQVIERINNQMPDEEKIKLADFIIYNNEKQSIIEQTEKIITKLI